MRSFKLFQLLIILTGEPLSRVFDDQGLQY
jgi:hypothetical protein